MSLTLPEARAIIYQAAARWADELSAWIIPGTDDEEDAEGYQEQLDELNAALDRIGHEAYNGHTPED